MGTDNNTGRTPPQSEVDQIAYRLTISREALGLKPADLCRRAKIQPNAYSQYENGKGRPSLDAARALRRTFGYTLDWIYEGDPSGLPHSLAAKIAEIEVGRASKFQGGKSGKGLIA